MNSRLILDRVDHTQLKPYAAWESIRVLCEEAIQYRTASVCVPPCYVAPIRRAFGDRLTICTVIGFPLGYQAARVKVFEARAALEDGADEVDMVINITDVKNGRLDRVRDEISAVKAAVGGKILKVIVETCYLTGEEKAAVCRAVTDAGADYIKTSTGFGTDGARLEDIRLFKEHIGPNVKIKAAGGMKTREDIEAFVAEGCDRLGTSSAVSILKGDLPGGLDNY